jgi:hypothetical protein
VRLFRRALLAGLAAAALAGCAGAPSYYYAGPFYDSWGRPYMRTPFGMATFPSGTYAGPIYYYPAIVPAVPAVPVAIPGGGNPASANE